MKSERRKKQLNAIRNRKERRLIEELGDDYVTVKMSSWKEKIAKINKELNQNEKQETN